MPFLKSLPEEATAMHVWALKPEAYAAWPKMIDAIMRTDSELSDGEKELIGAYSSALRGCTHCFTAHYPVAVAYGIDEDFFKDVMQDPDTAPIDEKLRPIIKFVHKFITDPHRMLQRDVDPIFEAGWSEKTLTDVVYICAGFGFMNTIVMGHGAHDVDASDIGPIHAIIREKDLYGHAEGSGRANPEDVMQEAIERFGEEATLKAVKRAKELGFGIRAVVED